MAKKKKKVITVEQIQEKKKEKDQEQKESLALHTLQSQLQNIKLKEWIVVISFIFGGAIGRSLMQGLPSVEPLTLFAVLAGILFGRNKGFLVGSGSLIASNFLVFGGHGPWTIFQFLGFGIAGYLGGFLSKKPSYVGVLTIMAIATVIFEIIVNVGSAFMFGFGAIFLLFLTALPFGIVHLVSNLAFALAIPKLAKIIWEKGKFNEKDLYLDLLNKYRITRKLLRRTESKSD